MLIDGFLDLQCKQNKDDPRYREQNKSLIDVLLKEEITRIYYFTIQELL